MGIEPTNRTVYVRLNGFEDRGHHQVYKHFPKRHPAQLKQTTQANVMRRE